MKKKKEKYLVEVNEKIEKSYFNEEKYGRSGYANEVKKPSGYVNKEEQRSGYSNPNEEENNKNKGEKLSGSEILLKEKRTLVGSEVLFNPSFKEFFQVFLPPIFSLHYNPTKFLKSCTQFQF